jgi:Na+/melibiose symporter-like transporter
MSDSGDSRWREHLVLWRPVLGLAAVQGSIILSWVIYRTYLPKLLTQVGFPEALAARLLLIEAVLAIALEPLMGGLSDRVKYWVGTRFPFISLGVILSSALFITIPASVAFGSLTGGMRWILPSLAVAWALAMTVFRSPVMALLIHYAVVPELPRAISVLVLVAGIMGAIAPFSSQFLLSLGPWITFAAGSLVMLVAVKVLRSLHPPEPPSAPAPESVVPLTSLLLGLASIAGVSLGISWGFRLLSMALSGSIVIPLPDVNLKIFTLIVGLVVAIGSLPAGIVGSRWGNSRTILIGIAATVGFLLVMGFVPYAVAISVAIVGLVAAFSLVNNSSIPFVFEAVPPHRIGLGMGTYFGSLGAASSLFEPLFGSIGTNPSTQAMYSAIAFLIAGISVAFNSLQIQR